MEVPQAPRWDHHNLHPSSSELLDHRTVVEEDHEPRDPQVLAVMHELAQHHLSTAALLGHRHDHCDPHGTSDLTALSTGITAASGAGETAVRQTQASGHEPIGWRIDVAAP